MSHRFQTAIELLTEPMILDSDQYITLEPRTIKLFKDSKPFTFVRTDKHVTIDEYIAGEVLDLPFECCWFEVLNSKMAPTENDDIAISGLFVYEKHPGYYAVIFLHTGGGSSDLVYVTDKNLFEYLLGLVKHLLIRLSSEKTGIQKVATKIRIKDTKGKNYKYRPNKMIVVSDRLNTPSGEDLGFEVDWSYQWQVRGHWRKLIKNQKLGKDRSDNTIRNGYTWIKPYFKGLSTDTIIIKDRVIT